jgi:hypothetical protein
LRRRALDELGQLARTTTCSHRGRDPAQVGQADLEVPAPGEHAPVGVTRDERQLRSQLGDRNLAHVPGVGDLPPVGHESPAQIDVIRALTDDAAQRRERPQRRAGRELGRG